MRYFKIALLFVMAVAAVLLAVANRGPVTLRILPEPLAAEGLLPGGLPNETSMPIFAALLGAMFFGVIVGLVMEAIREGGHRREERRWKRETARLNRENKRLQAKAGEEDDDILGLKRA